MEDPALQLDQEPVWSVRDPGEEDLVAGPEGEEGGGGEGGRECPPLREGASPGWQGRRPVLNSQTIVDSFKD